MEAHGDGHSARECSRVQITTVGSSFIAIRPRLLHARRLCRRQRVRQRGCQRRGAQREFCVGRHPGAARGPVRAAGARMAARGPAREDGSGAGRGRRRRGTAGGVLAGTDGSASFGRREQRARDVDRLGYAAGRRAPARVPPGAGDSAVHGRVRAARVQTAAGGAAAEAHPVRRHTACTGHVRIRCAYRSCRGDEG